MKKVVLEGPRLLLRPVTGDDVTQRYCDWLNDPEVNRFLETRFQTQTSASIDEYVRSTQAMGDTIFLAIMLKEADLHIGNIKLGPVHPRYRRGDLSFFIGEKKNWGLGLGSEAVALMTDFGLSKLGLVKITAGCYHNNIGSKRVFEKNGYVLEGKLRKQYSQEGTWVDMLCFAKFSQ